MMCQGIDFMPCRCGGQIMLLMDMGGDLYAVAHVLPSCEQYQALEPDVFLYWHNHGAIPEEELDA